MSLSAQYQPVCWPRPPMGISRSRVQTRAVAVTNGGIQQMTPHARPGAACGGGGAASPGAPGVRRGFGSSSGTSPQVVRMAAGRSRNSGETTPGVVTPRHPSVSLHRGRPVSADATSPSPMDPYVNLSSSTSSGQSRSLSWHQAACADRRSTVPEGGAAPLKSEPPPASLCRSRRRHSRSATVPA